MTIAARRRQLPKLLQPLMNGSRHERIGAHRQLATRRVIVLIDSAVIERAVSIERARALSIKPRSLTSRGVLSLLAMLSRNCSRHEPLPRRSQRAVSRSAGAPTRAVSRSAGAPTRAVSRSAGAPTRAVSRSAGTPTRAVSRSAGAPTRAVLVGAGLSVASARERRRGGGKRHAAVGSQRLARHGRAWRGGGHPLVLPALLALMSRQDAQLPARASTRSGRPAPHARFRAASPRRPRLELAARTSTRSTNSSRHEEATQRSRSRRRPERSRRARWSQRTSFEE